MLYIVTPVSRPENYKKIKDSVLQFENKLKRSTQFNWVVLLDGKIPDLEKFICKNISVTNYNEIVIDSPFSNSLGGYSHRNWFLDHIYYRIFKLKTIENDWVYFLDDDTLLHPEFLSEILSKLDDEKAAIIFDQENKDYSTRLWANIDNVKVGKIDIGQYVLNLEKLPSEVRFNETEYCADGILIEELLQKVGPENFLVINKTLSTYNKLR